MFSFIIARLFHHGIVAIGIRAEAPQGGRDVALAVPLCTSDSPYMISRPPGRSSR